MTHICVSKIISIGSHNGLSPGRRQAIIWTNTGILLIGPLGTNFSENLIEILTFSFTKMRLKVSSAKWWPFCVGLNVIIPLAKWRNPMFPTKSRQVSRHFKCTSPHSGITIVQNNIMYWRTVCPYIPSSSQMRYVLSILWWCLCCVLTHIWYPGGAVPRWLRNTRGPCEALNDCILTEPT